MLTDANQTIKKQYYDQKLHGMDLDNRLQEAENKIRDGKSFSEALGVVAWYVDALHDSHTFFIPPQRPLDIQNGWEMGFVGDNCYITAVQTGSDAAAKGIKPGDQVLSIEGFRPTRENSWKLHYAFNVIAPRPAMHFVLATAGSPPRQLEVKSAVTQLPRRLEFANDMWDLIRRYENFERENKVRYADAGEVHIEKIPQFTFEDSELERILGRAKQHPALVLDVRANPGGRAELLTRLVGGLFDHEVKIADRAGRRDQKPETAKSQGDHTFGGKLVVLIDSGSASASELLARVVQLQKRGTVMGDRSSGAVMEAKLFFFDAGVSGDYGYGFEVTQFDLIMSDGKSLEHVGVMPDQLALPSPEDLAAGRDPVLAKAVELVGGKITPEAAGKLFPVVWHKSIAW